MSCAGVLVRDDAVGVARLFQCLPFSRRQLLELGVGVRIALLEGLRS